MTLRLPPLSFPAPLGASHFSARPEALVFASRYTFLEPAWVIHTRAETVGAIERLLTCDCRPWGFSFSCPSGWLLPVLQLPQPASEVLGQKCGYRGDGGAPRGDAQLGDQHFRQFPPLRGVSRRRLPARNLLGVFSKQADEF